MSVIDKDMYVAINFNLSLDGGERIDFTKEGEPFGFVTGFGMIVPGLEKALMGKEVGYRSSLVVDPEDGFGPAYQELYQNLPRTQFPSDVDPQPGMTFHTTGSHGDLMVTVDAINDDDTVTINMNHPLAGKRLLFDVDVVEVRKPTDEELVEAKRNSEASGEEQGNEAGKACGCGCNGS
ncbi:MAG: peptidylprolyl isomerase [Desulfobulbaceae bacterium]|nr:peptidylprolyl isomerase [Desulfobulbaceae bacterium]